MSFNQFKQEMKAELKDKVEKLKTKEYREELLYTAFGLLIIGVVVNAISKRT